MQRHSCLLFLCMFLLVLVYLNSTIIKRINKYIRINNNTNNNISEKQQSKYRNYFVNNKCSKAMTLQKKKIHILLFKNLFHQIMTKHITGITHHII